MKRGLISRLRWTKMGTEPQTATERFARPPVPRQTTSTGRSLDLFGIPEVPPEASRPATKDALAGRVSAADTARYLLRAAAEIEHGLLVQYLYSSYSIVQLPVPKGWIRTIRGIAIQEMDHLITVQNLLLGLKNNNFQPYFDRANFPVSKENEGFYPYPFRLEPFTADSLSKYVSVESPLPDSISDAALRTELEAVIKRAEAAAGLKTFGHVGNLYAYLYWLFLPTDDAVGPWQNFPADWFHHCRPDYHVKPEDFADTTRLDQLQVQATEVAANDGNAANYPANDDGSHRWVFTVKSAADALRAIAQIAIQGEGTEVAADSHFMEFLGVYREVGTFPTPAGGSIHLNVPIDPHLRPNPGVPNGLIVNPTTRLWAQLCNIRYLMLLQELPLILSLNRLDAESNARRSTLLLEAVKVEMTTGIKYFAGKLMTMPLDTSPTDFAGPPFELPDDELPLTPADQWKELVRLIGVTKDLFAQLRALTGPGKPTNVDLSLFNSLEQNDQELLQTVPQEFQPPTSQVPPKAIAPLNSFSDVQNMFNTFVSINNIDLSASPHGAFWTTDYNAFVTGDVPGVPGVKILVKGDADHSNLVQILKGPIAIAGQQIEQMPLGGPFFSIEMVKALAEWINLSCPP